jgi:RNA polymerase sigma-70 factor, ECF subfamily
MPNSSSEEVTQLLHKWNEGDRTALEKLIPLVDDQLRRLAHGLLHHKRPEHDLETTALIGETFLRVLRGPEITWENHTHFFAVAARIMRNILIDSARAQLSEKRGGGAEHKRLEDAEHLPDTTSSETRKAVELLALDEALNHLAELDARKSAVVDLKYFGGLTIGEIAEVLGMSPHTVERDWRFARSWLKRELIVKGPSQLDVSRSTEKHEAHSSVTADAERKLAEAWSNRELVATLMTEHWAGLKLLVQLRPNNNIAKSQLVSAVGIDANVIDSLLLKLEELGALEKQDDSFSLTKWGNTLIENLESAIGNTFD